MRLMKQILKYDVLVAHGRKTPAFWAFAGSMGLTHKCSSRCLHCTRWRREFKQGSRNAPELTTKQAKKLIDQLAELGLKITFLTTGLVVNERIASKIVKCGVDVLYFPLDGSTPQINDRVRGIRGALEKPLEAVKLCQKARGKGKMEIMAPTVAFKNSLGDLEDIVTLAKESGIDGLIIQPFSFFVSLARLIVLWLFPKKIFPNLIQSWSG